MTIPFGDVVALLLYLLPGFLAMQLYRARYPGKRVSQFEVVVWSVLHSFFVQIGLVAIAYAFHLNHLVPLRRDAGSMTQPQVIAVLLGAGIAWGLILIVQHWVRVKVKFVSSPDPQAIWPIISGRASREELWALVRTKQGLLYLGWISRYSFDPNAEDHEFLLQPAYLVDEELNVKRNLQKGGVYLNTRDIEAMEMMPGR